MSAFTRASDAALELLDRYGVEEARDILETDIAYAEGLRVVYGELGSAGARLTLLGGRGTIRLPSEQRGLPWSRFGIAHELGHFLLHQGTGAFCQDAHVEGWCVDETREAEANAFAAELLMPEHLVRRECDVHAPSLDAAWGIARCFDVSFPAAALRLVELTRDPCAFAVVVKDSVRCFRESRTWPFSPLRRGDAVDARALAARLAGTGRTRTERVSVGAWTGFDHDGELIESCIDAPRYGRTVSLLACSTRAAAA